MVDAAGSEVGPIRLGCLSGTNRPRGSLQGREMTQTFEARAVRSRLETLARCGSSLHGEPALEVIGGLAIGNSEGVSKVWADVALLAATQRPTTSEAIHDLTRAVLPDVLDRMRPNVARKARKRGDVLLGVVYSELAMLSLGRRRIDTAHHRAKTARIRYGDYLAIEGDVVSIVNDRVENAAGQIRRAPW